MSQRLRLCLRTSPVAALAMLLACSQASQLKGSQAALSAPESTVPPEVAIATATPIYVPVSNVNVTDLSLQLTVRVADLQCTAPAWNLSAQRLSGETAVDVTKQAQWQIAAPSGVKETALSPAFAGSDYKAFTNYISKLCASVGPGAALTLSVVARDDGLESNTGTLRLIRLPPTPASTPVKTPTPSVCRDDYLALPFAVVRSHFHAEAAQICRTQNLPQQQARNCPSPCRFLRNEVSEPLCINGSSPPLCGDAGNNGQNREWVCTMYTRCGN